MPAHAGARLARRTGLAALAWMLERSGGTDHTDNPSARFRARNDHAVRQVRASQVDGEAVPVLSPADRFARGASALLTSGGTTLDPDAVSAAVRKAEAEVIASTVADRLHRSFQAEGRSLEAVDEDDRASVVRRFVADRRFAADRDAEAARFLAQIQDDLRDEKLPERRARIIFEQARGLAADPLAGRRSPTEAAAALGELKSGLARQDASIASGLSDSIARLGRGDVTAIAAAAATVDSAVASARNVTPDLLKTIDALERLGVIGQSHAELTAGVARFDTALSIVQGSIAVSMANPAGVVQVLQGLADLVAPAKAAGDGRGAFLGRIGTRLDDVAIVLEESSRKLDRLQESLTRLRLEMAISFERQERELERLRKELTGLVANAALQDFESCVLVEDVLRKASRLQVVPAAAGGLTVTLGGDWAGRLRILRSEPASDRERPPILLQECRRSLLRLFGTDQVASVSKPFIVPAVREGSQDRGAGRRHAFLIQALLGEMDGGAGRAVSPEGLLRYVGRAGWIDRPSEAARAWWRIARGERRLTSPGVAPIDPERLFRDEQIDADRLRIVARVVLYLAPLFWLEADTAETFVLAGAAASDHPGVRVLSNLAALLDRAVTDEALTDGLVGVPAAMSLHDRRAAHYVRRFDEAAAQQRVLAALPATDSEARRAAAAELAVREQALADARAALLELEAVIGASETFWRLAVDYALYRAGLPAATRDANVADDDSPAHARLADVWRIGLAGKALARGSRRWVNGDGEARDVYREVIGGTSFAWQLDQLAARDHLHDPAICRATDGGEPAWIARSPHREELLALCARLSASPASASVARFGGRPVGVPRLGTADRAVAGDRLRDLRHLAGETRLILRLAQSSVIDDGSDRPLVIAQR